MTELTAYFAHVANVTLPGRYHRLTLAGVPIGYLAPPVRAALQGEADLADEAALTAAETRLERAGLFRRRGEAFDVRATPGGGVLGQVDRGALPVFGILASGVHMNGYVRRGGALWLWIARRSMAKPLDPGLLDHLVAGGISAGMNADDTLVKEAWEEAGIPAALAGTARQVSTISYAMARAEGLRRDHLYCYDLELPEDFTPIARDGEVESFTLRPAEAVLAGLRGGEGFKFNVALVLIDFLIRHGVIAGAEAAAVRRHLET